MNLRALVVVISSLVALNAYASIALAASKVVDDAEKASSEATKTTSEEAKTTETVTTGVAKEASAAEAKASADIAKASSEVHKAETSVENAATEAGDAAKEKASADVYKAENAVDKATTEAEKATKEEASTVEHKTESTAEKVAQEAEKEAKDTGEKIENATKEAGDTVSDWFDSVTGKVKSWLSKTPETAQKYSDEVKKQYFSAKESVQSNVKEGVAKGKEATETVTQWFDKTFSKHRIDEAKQWLIDFKNGTEEKVIDPLVPYLLAIRYPHPIDEWDAGYRRMFNVQLKGYDKPVDIQLPMSWAITETLNVDGNKIIAWRSDSGDGQLMTAIIHTPNGASVESVIAGLEKDRPKAQVVSIGNEGIKRITFLAMDDSHNAYYYYAIPLAGRTLELCTGVIRTGGENHDELNKRLEERADFFNLVAESVFTKATPEAKPTE